MKTILYHQHTTVSNTNLFLQSLLQKQAKTTITTAQKYKITITGNITDKNKNPINNAPINIKIAETDTGTITSSNGKFSHEYTITQSKGAYDVIITALESNTYCLMLSI